MSSGGPFGRSDQRLAPRTPSASACTCSCSARGEAGRGAALLVERARDPIDQRRADHRGIGDPGDLGRLLGRADAEADRDRQAGVAAQARDRPADQVDHRRADAR